MSPRNAAVMPVAAPSFTPMAHIASKRISRSACSSTSDSRASPPGCVWIQRIPDRRSTFLRSVRSGSDTLFAEPTEISSTSPSRLRYTISSRFSWSVKRTSVAISRSGRNLSRSSSVSNSFSSSSSADCRIPSIFPRIISSIPPGQAEPAG